MFNDVAEGLLCDPVEADGSIERNFLDLAVAHEEDGQAVIHAEFLAEALQCGNEIRVIENGGV